MLPSPMGLEPEEPISAPESSDWGLFLVLVVAGLLPFLGMALTGAWSEREIAIGGILLVMAMSGALGRRKRRAKA